MPEQTSFQPNKITTNGGTFWDEDGVMLRLGYLDESFSIQISTPLIGENGKRTYPEKNRHNLLMTPDRASALFHEVIMKQLLPAYAQGENMSKGVFLNKGKTAILDVKVENGQWYLLYHKDIGEDRKAKETYGFHFNKTDVIEGYKSDTGEFAGQQEVDGVFYIFCKYLEMGVNEVCKSSGHSIRCASNYTITSVFNYLKALSQKLGVTVEPAYRRSTPSGFNTPPMNTPSGDSQYDTPPSVEEMAPTDMAGMLA